MPSLVQSASNYDVGNTGAVAVTFDTPTTPGNLVLLCVADYQEQGPYDITDDQGNSYGNAIDDNSQDYEMAVFFLLVTNGVNTITVTAENPGGGNASAPPMQCITMEWNGVSNGALDQISDVVSDDGALINWASDPITTLQTDLLIGFACQLSTGAPPQAGITITSTGSWTDVISGGFAVQGGTAFVHWSVTNFVQYISSELLGTYNAAGTTSGTSSLDALILSFVIGSAPPPVGVPQMFDYQIQIT